MPADGHEYYKTNDAKDALLDINGKEVKGQPKEGELEIENGVTEIEEYEYYGGNLTSVFISKSVTYIGTTRSRTAGSRPSTGRGDRWGKARSGAARPLFPSQAIPR